MNWYYNSYLVTYRRGNGITSITWLQSHRKCYYNNYMVTYQRGKGITTITWLESHR